MADTSQRLREQQFRHLMLGAEIVRDRPGSMLYDSWAVCPLCPDLRSACNERDGTAWFVEHLAEYRCMNDHRFTETMALWEVERR